MNSTTRQLCNSVRSRHSSSTHLRAVVTLLFPFDYAALAVEGPAELIERHPVSRDIRQGESHRYTFDAAAQKEYAITVSQHEYDVLLELSKQNRPVSTTNSPLKELSTETAYVGIPGRYSLEVSAIDRERTAGSYSIVVDEITDAATGVALRATAEADLHRDAPTAERIQLYENAYAAWTNIDSARAAHAKFAAGYLAKWLYDHDTAASTLAEAQELYRRSGDPVLAGWSAYWRGSVFSGATRYREAREVFENALADLQSPGALRLRAMLRNYIGLTFHLQGATDAAKTHYAQALSILAKGHFPFQEAMILNNLGGIYVQSGKPEIAGDFFDRVLRTYKELENTERTAEVLGNIARIQLRLGEFDRAFATLSQAENLSPFDEVSRGGWLRTVGDAYEKLGDRKGARTFYLAALERASKADDNRARAGLHKLLGSLARTGGQLDAALRHGVTSIELYRTIEDRIGEMSAAIGYADSLLDAGDHPTATKILLNVKSTLATTEDDELVPLYGDLFQTEGRLHEAELRLESAADAFREAHRIRRETKNPMGVVESLVSLARVSLEEGRLNDAYQTLESVESNVRKIHAEIPSDSLRSSFFASLTELFDFQVQVLMRRAKSEPGKRSWTAALESSENGRALLIKERLARARIPDDSKTAALKARERTLVRDYTALLIDADAAGDRTQTELAELLSAIAAAERQLKTLEEDVGSHPFKTQTLQSALGEDEAAMYFAVGARSSYAWVVLSNEVYAYPLPSRKTLRDTVASVVSSIKENALPSGAWRKDLAQLGDALLAPAVDRVRGKTVYIVPDDILHALPFAVLPTSGSEAGADAPLIDIATPTIVPSLQFLAGQGKPRREITRVAVVADPVFGAEDVRLRGRKSAVVPVASQPSLSELITLWPSVPQHAGSGARKSLPRLPFSGAEAEAIRTVFGSEKVMLRTGFDATKASALDDGTGNYDVLHFATHALLNGAMPQLSGLVFSQIDEQGKPRDGILRLPEIYRLRLSGQLVVLSSCESALGENVVGEGPTSLARGFLSAGARQVVATLWPVSDRITAKLMDSFYTRLARNRASPAVALREAQLELRSQRDWAHPYYWAGLVLIGVDR